MRSVSSLVRRHCPLQSRVLITKVLNSVYLQYRQPLSRNVSIVCHGLIPFLWQRGHTGRVGLAVLLNASDRIILNSRKVGKAKANAKQD